MLFPNSSTTRDPALLLLFVGLCALLLLPVISNAQQQQDNNAAEELSSSSLVLGVDCSWPMHSFPLRHPNWEENHHVVHRYLQYMEGCSEYYSEEECRTSDRERMAMNYYQTAAMQNYTSAGYAKVEAPKAVVDTLQSFYHEHQRQHMIREKWPPGAIYTNHWSAPTKMVPLDGLPTATATTTMGDQPSLSKQQRAEIIAQIQPILETWSKMPLIPTSLYGIRQYGRGSILSPHVDRLPLVISAIINVAQDVEEPWPLEVIGHDGKALNITMEPGDLVLYEGASVIHGRPYPLQGNSYANVFLHFEPVGHTERHMGLRKEPKELFEQALQKQQRMKNLMEETPRQRKKDTLPYYVDAEKEEQWTQDYVYVKRPTIEKAKDKKGARSVLNDKNHPRRIHNLAAMGDLKSIQAMVREDPGIITKKDENGWTPLHEAARSGETEVVEYLCKMLDQESINYRTNNGMGATALWWALHMFDEDHPTVKVLIRYGARSIAPKSKTKTNKK